MLLQVTAAVVLLVASTQGRSPPIQAGKVKGEILYPADGSVELIARVSGGYPLANKFTWTLPGGFNILPGQVHGTYEAVRVSEFHHKLICRAGLTSSPQQFRFRAENLWWYNQYYSLPARNGGAGPKPTPGRDDKFSVLTGETDFNSDGSVTIDVTVTGGSPTPNRFTWTVPGGVTISPGQTHGDFQAWYRRTNSDGSSTYRLIMKHGQTSYAQKITFKCEAVGYWHNTYTVTIPSKTAANLRGSVHGNSVIDWATGTVTITTWIQGGHPAANNFQWTVQNPNGSTSKYSPGQGPTTAMRKNSMGYMSSTLTVYGKSHIGRRFEFYCSSTRADGTNNWWASRYWNIPQTA